MNPTPENKAFRFFISQGCDPQMPNDVSKFVLMVTRPDNYGFGTLAQNGNTALMMACTVCHTAVISFLVECAVVDVNEQNHVSRLLFPILYPIINISFILWISSTAWYDCIYDCVFKQRFPCYENSLVGGTCRS